MLERELFSNKTTLVACSLNILPLINERPKRELLGKSLYQVCLYAYRVRRDRIQGDPVAQYLAAEI